MGELSCSAAIPLLHDFLRRRLLFEQDANSSSQHPVTYDPSSSMTDVELVDTTPKKFDPFPLALKIGDRVKRCL